MMPSTRRSTLLGAAALIGSASRLRAADVDVAIVGAGAAGIAAARRIGALGRTCLVLEARDRLGGRAFTDQRLGAPFDAGAQFLHWSERNPLVGVAEMLGVATAEEQSGSGGFSVFANGAVLPEAERDRRRRAFGRIGGLIAAGAAPDRSIAAAVAAGGPDDSDSAGGLTRLTLGEEPDRVSAADYEALWAGNDLVCPDGFGALVARAGQGLPVRLASPVTRADWGGPGVMLEGPFGRVTARAAILTVSLGVLQAASIAFSPALPGVLLDAVGGLGMGAYTKIALRIDRTRPGASAITDAIDIGQNGALMSLEAWPFERDLLMFYLGGDFARRLCEAGEAAAVDHARSRVRALFGQRARDAVTGGALAAWWTDPFARGSYSVARPGRLASRDALRRPVGDRLWFAGEASAGGGAMTVGGAWLEGERAADDVVRTLRP